MIASWCRAGVHYVIFDRGDDRSDDAAAAVKPAASFRWLKQPGLNPKLLFSAHGVDVLAVHPCSARTP
jgi:hypothetical protein